MIIDVLRQEHRNIETLLLVLEQEMSIFDRAERPDYEVIWAVIAYSRFTLMYTIIRKRTWYSRS